MQTISVRTTQNVFIHYPIASLGDRIAAYFIDAAIMIAYIIFWLIIILLINTGGYSSGVLMIIFGLPLILYHLLSEVFMDGQSPGKRQMNIKVVRVDGTPATLGNYVVRWLMRVVDIQFFSGLIAIIVIAASGKGQRLGDLAAGTTVIKMVAQREATAREVFTLPEENYVPAFSNVVHYLSDRDVELIQQALVVYRDTNNEAPLIAIGEKIEAMLGIQTDMTPAEFLKRVINDYTHLSAGNG